MDTTPQPSSSSSTGDNWCICVVCSLLKKGISQRSFQDGYDVISKGRPIPSIKLETRVKNFTRYFNTNFYTKHQWLTACETTSKLFCWPCLLFNVGEKTMWNSSGCLDLNNFHKYVKRHVNNKGHLTAIIKEKTYGITHLEHSLDDQLQISHKLHNELVKKNRDILKRLIDVTCFLGERELNYSEGTESTNMENYIDLIELVAKYDETLKNHLRGSNVFQGTSSAVRNDLIKCVTEVVLANVKCEIKTAPFVSIVLDETTNLTGLSQLAVIVRYVRTDRTVQERFFKFLDTSSDRTAGAIYKNVCNIIENLKCGSKLVAQSYDGATVAAGHLGSLQTKVKETFQNAVFVHCCAHQLNLVLSQALSEIKDCKVFFVTLNGLVSFFLKSSKRTSALDIQVEKIYPKAPHIQLKYNGTLVQTISRYQEALIELFKDILDKKEQWDAETVNSSTGYLQLFETDFNFNFLLNVFSEILPYTDTIFDTLQTTSNNIGECVQNINDFENQLIEKREQFQHFWQKTCDMGFEPQNKRIKLDNVITFHHKLFLEIFDNITQELRVRFRNFNELKFIELCNFNSYNSHFPDQSFNSLKLNYDNLFDIAALRSQLSVLYETPEVNKHKTPSSMMAFLKETGLDSSYCEVDKLCQLVLTIPTTASVGHSFSLLKRIKNFVGNSTGGEMSSNLAMLSIEKDYINELSQNPKFYDDVIEEFAKIDRGIELQYK